MGAGHCFCCTDRLHWFVAVKASARCCTWPCTANHVHSQHSTHTARQCRHGPFLFEPLHFLQAPCCLCLFLEQASILPCSLLIPSPAHACLPRDFRYKWLVQREVHILAPSPNWRLSAWETWEFLSLLMNRDICAFLGRWPPGARGHPKVKQFPLSPPIETLTRGKLCCSLRK